MTVFSSQREMIDFSLFATPGVSTFARSRCPPPRRAPLEQEWPSIYEQVSYEVGGDVFSLQELEHCVLRGRLPRPGLKDLPKRFAPLPPEGDDHYAYSVGKVRRCGVCVCVCANPTGARFVSRAGAAWKV